MVSNNAKRTALTIANEGSMLALVSVVGGEDQYRIAVGRLQRMRKITNLGRRSREGGCKQGATNKQYTTTNDTLT